MHFIDRVLILGPFSSLFRFSSQGQLCGCVCVYGAGEVYKQRLITNAFEAVLRLNSARQARHALGQAAFVMLLCGMPLCI